MTFQSVARRAWRYGAYPAFGLAAFAASLYVTFPYDRLRDRLVHSLQSGREMEVSIGAVEPGWGGGLVLRDVAVRPVADDPDQAGAPLKIREAEVSFGLLAALFGSLEAEFSAELLRGELEGEIDRDAEGTHVRLSTDGLTLDDFPWIPSAIGLPLLGKMRAQIDLTLPKDSFAQASGSIDLDCRGCALGDGKAKFKLAGAGGFLADGLTLPKLRIGDWKGRMMVEKGTAKIEGFESKSPDGETGLEGEVGLRDPIAQSQMRAYFRFRLADQLKVADPKLDLLERGLSASGRRTDGFYGVRISGRLGAMRFLPSRYSPTGTTRERGTARPSSRRPAAAKPFASPAHREEEEPAEEEAPPSHSGARGKVGAGRPASPPVPPPAPPPVPPSPAIPTPPPAPPPSEPAPPPAPPAPPEATPPAEPAPPPPPAEEPTPPPQ